MRIAFPWFTLYATPRRSRVACLVAMLYHELLHVFRDPHTPGLGYRTTLRYNIGFPITAPRPGLRGSEFVIPSDAPLPDVVDGAFLYRTATTDAYSNGAYGEVTDVYRGNASTNSWERIGPGGEGGSSGVAGSQITLNKGTYDAIPVSEWTTFPFTSAGDPDPIGDLFSWDDETGFVTVARDAYVGVTTYINVNNAGADGQISAYWWHGDDDDTGPWYYFTFDSPLIPTGNGSLTFAVAPMFLAAGDKIRLVIRTEAADLSASQITCNFVGFESTEGGGGSSGGDWYSATQDEEDVVTVAFQTKFGIATDTGIPYFDASSIEEGDEAVLLQDLSLIRPGKSGRAILATLDDVVADPFHIATVTLNNEQLESLHETPISLIEAPGAGKYIAVFASHYQWRSVDGNVLEDFQFGPFFDDGNPPNTNYGDEGVNACDDWDTTLPRQRRDIFSIGEPAFGQNWKRETVENRAVVLWANPDEVFIAGGDPVAYDVHSGTPGAGYAVGDTGYIVVNDPYNLPASYEVTAVDMDGGVTAFLITPALGIGYFVGDNQPTFPGGAQPGAGDGNFNIDITEVTEPTCTVYWETLYRIMDLH